jgi:hypothetical protein
MVTLFGTVAFSFSFDSLSMIYLTLVRSELEYVFVVCNFITSTDAKKLERIQPKFIALCYNRVFHYV